VYTDGTMHLTSAAASANLQKLFSLNSLIRMGFGNRKVFEVTN
jgi:hypothetical protein